MDKSNLCVIDENEEIVLINSDEEKVTRQLCDRWKVLIVDDDEYVHSITKLSLHDLVYKDKSMEMYSAYSAKEAIEVLQKIGDIALIFVDVVMEEDDSGLKLVRYIRDELQNKIVRVILRTGQPGQAPEKRVIVEYDINDYKLKTELTADNLFVAVVSALRAYSDLEKLEQNRKGLEQIIRSSTEIFKDKSLNEFMCSILEQLSAIIALGKDVKELTVSGLIAKKEKGQYIIKVAIGEMSQYVDWDVNKINDENLIGQIKVAESDKTSHCKQSFVYYFKSQFDDENIVYMKSNKELMEIEGELIEIFMTSISVAFDNVYLDREIASTQREIIYTLGEIAEARSQEVGNHVKRVAEYSKLLALKIGMSEDESDVLKYATAMHDVGKLAIQDAILNKPGKLTDEEFGIIKTHSKAGHDMLKGSKGSIMNAAAIVALQHHEKYNGKGYPLGLRGKSIHIYGRISAISDVFDALGSERVYKKAWELDKIVEYFKEERGRHFDPELVDVFLENLNEFVAIRDKFKDF